MTVTNWFPTYTEVLARDAIHSAYRLTFCGDDTWVRIVSKPGTQTVTMQVYMDLSDERLVVSWSTVSGCVVNDTVRIQINRNAAALLAALAATEVNA